MLFVDHRKFNECTFCNIQGLHIKDYLKKKKTLQLNINSYKLAFIGTKAELLSSNQQR